MSDRLLVVITMLLALRFSHLACSGASESASLFIEMVPEQLTGEREAKPGI